MAIFRGPILSHSDDNHLACAQHGRGRRREAAAGEGLLTNQNFPHPRPKTDGPSPGQRPSEGNRRRNDPKPNYLWHIGIAALVAILSAGCATQQRPLQPPELKLLTGETFNLADTAESHNATVLIWWATQCPCVKRYQKRSEALVTQFANHKLAFYAVASNADDSREDLLRVSRKRNFQLPIIVDPGAHLAQSLGVTTTPTAVILDNKGAIRFFGWIDNECDVHVQGRKAYLEDALRSLLAGEPIERPKTPVHGCMITR